MSLVTRLYKVLLRLYPRDCRGWCAPEMLDAFENAAREHRARGFAAFIRFGLEELSGLLVEGGAAWIAKFTSSKYMRGFWIPSTMRRAGQSREDWCPPGARVLSDVYTEEDLRARNR